jgi:hypothetical protein
MINSLHIAAAAALSLAVPVAATAQTFDSTYSHSGNFCSTAPVENGLAGGENGPFGGFGNEAVGVNMAAAQWMNDLTSTQAPFNSQGFNYGASDTAAGAGALARPGAAGTNLYSWNGAGLPDSYSVSWTANRQDANDNRTVWPPITRHGQLMAGYLYAFDIGDTITLSSSGIADLLTAAEVDEYSVTLYINGEEDANPPEITTYTAALTAGGTPITYYGEDVNEFLDSDQTVSNFVQITSTTPGVYQGGNYITFSGLTSDFSITLTGVGSGVVLNGFDVNIPAVPLPGTLALLSVGVLLPGVLRRRKRAV